MNYKRYARQLALPGFGPEGQQKLLNACVAIVGMGGLGCPAAQSLAAAGIGRMILIDGDTIQLHNLHRQFLYTTKQIGQKKAETAAVRLRDVNPDIQIDAHDVFLSIQNVENLLADADVVIDGTDQIEIRYLLDNWSRKSQKPWIHAGLFRHEFLVAVFNSQGNGPFYADVFPDAPDADSVPPCEVAGVFPMMPAIAGNIQAQEAIRLLLGEKGGLQGKMLSFNGWEFSWRMMEVG